MINYIFKHIAVFVCCVSSCSKCCASHLRVISDSLNTTAFVKKTNTKKNNEYIIKIIANNDTLKQKVIKMDSVHNFTKAYCSDSFIALTNSNTNDKAAMCVLDIRNNDILVCEADFDINNELISTYTKSKLTTTVNGCYVEMIRVWHNDDWNASEDALYLRLGDAIPNECTIEWIYNAKTKLFKILNYGRNKSKKYNITQYRIKGSVLR